MVAKSFPRKQVPTKNFNQIFLVENCLWSQNHFLENRYLLKIVIKFFGRKFFMVAKSFPPKQVPIKNVHQIFLVENFLLSQNHLFPRKQVPTKNFHQISLDENCLWSQNHFLENRFILKIYMKFFRSKIFYGRKLISSKTGSY